MKTINILITIASVSIAVNIEGLVQIIYAIICVVCMIKLGAMSGYKEGFSDGGKYMSNYFAHFIMKEYGKEGIDKYLKHVNEEETK